jgi:hypothetical protein
VHGPRWTSREEPLSIHVSAYRSEHAEFDGVGDRQFDIMGSSTENRVLTIPLGRAGSHLQEIFADRIAGIFLRQTYGTTAEWMVTAEEIIAAMAAGTGKKLPTVTSDFFRGVVPTTATFDKIVRPDGAFDAAKRTQIVSYVMLFRIGPSAYRQAYRAFLAELRQTCDGATALRKHLLCLDQEKMRRAAAAMTKRMKPPRRRKR